MKPVAVGYVCRVNAMCEPFGVSHAVVDHVRTEHRSIPMAACHADLRYYNWTLNPSPKTQLCPHCDKLTERKR